ncbi:MAG: DUF6470 family protein [Peptococcaceae bacterium]|jgi:hypothetical protein|nr:DUF6470 family protein [Peptococcaceae bacterium]
MLQIQISQQPILTQFTRRNAALNLTSTPAQVNIDAQPARLEMKNALGIGQLSIDQTPCRYSLGMKTLTAFTADLKDERRQAFLDGVSRVVQEGYRAAQIENPQDAFAENAASLTISEPVQITLGWIQRPDISYEPAPLQFDPIPGVLSYTVTPGGVQGDYQPGSLDIQVVQYPQTQISVLDVQL